MSKLCNSGGEVFKKITLGMEINALKKAQDEKFKADVQRRVDSIKAAERQEVEAKAAEEYNAAVENEALKSL